MAVNEEDLFVYAATKVKNKSVLQRVGHSAKLHMARSAISSPGSAGSKAINLLGAAGRSALGAIPIPMVGSLVGAVEKCVQDYAKKKYRKRQLAGAKAAKDNTAGVVKFELKSLSIDELDRFRWKVEEALKDFNKALASHKTNLTAKVNEGAMCDAYLELAIAAEQATRRINKLKESCETIQKVMKMTLDWLKLCEDGTHTGSGVAKAGVDGTKNAILKELKDYVDSLLAMPKGDAVNMMMQQHVNCGDWCWAKDTAKPDDYAAYKDRAAKVMKFLTAPFEIEGVVEMSSSAVADKLAG